MTKLLITGSKGQLGSELFRLREQYSQFEYIFTDVDTLDITDSIALDNFLNKEKVDYLINCAAYTAVDKAELNENDADRLNHLAVKNLAEAAIKHSFKIIHISTDYVYSGQNFRPYAEDDRTEPMSVYGSTKLAGEKEVLRNKCGIIIRTSWLYSTFGNNFVKSMIRLGKEREQLSIVFDQVGTPTYAGDLALAIMKIICNLIENKRPFEPEIFHYSNEGVTSWYDFAQEIISMAGITCNVNPIETKDYPSPVTRPFYSVLNKAKIKSRFGLQIPHWKVCLSKCIKELEN
jgi:dTDP-4-dehydrorhamnose reductase